MTMDFIIISAIILFTCISIVLGIVNWAKLSSASSQISNLEEAIEKKTKEFDTLKKERQTTPHVLYSDVARRDGLADGEEPLHKSEPAHAPIEIVRSLPTGFKVVGVESMPTSHPFSATVPDDFQKMPDSMRSETVEITLFSQTKKDTDFASAWKTLSAHLSASTSPQIVLNFKDVMFLYEKELDYLEKILEVVAKAHGSITFSNYHNELRSILSSRPAIVRALQK
jgi:hypothetical protein